MSTTIDPRSDAGDSHRGDSRNRSPRGEMHAESRRGFHTLTGLQILGSGAAVPDEVMRNEDLAELGYDADWIVQRTGIRERRYAPEGVATSDLAYEAARACLAGANASLEEIDLIVLATMTPDHPMPSAACYLQDRLGAQAAAMDVNAACSGFMYALATAAQFVHSGSSRTALVVGADLMSRTVNPADKKTYPLFGDGAGAVLLGRGSSEQGLLSYTLGSDGAGAGLLYMPAGGTREPLTPARLADGRQFMSMDGRPVFKWAVRLVADVIRAVAADGGVALEDVDTFVLHQANTRIIDAVVADLAVDPDRVVVNLDRYGNTSAGSIPLAIHEARQQNRIQPGHLVMLCGFGAGLTWGAALVRW